MTAQYTIKNCAKQRQCKLTDIEFKNLADQQKIIAKYGSADEKVGFYLLILEQVKNTINGTPEHGHYLALQQHFHRCCQHFDFDVSNACKLTSARITSPQVSPAA